MNCKLETVGNGGTGAMSARLQILGSLAVLCIGSPAFAQPRVFMVPAGQDPTAFPSGPTTIQVERATVQAGGFTLTFGVYLEDTSPTRVRGYQFTLDDATGGNSGVVDYDPDVTPPAIDTLRADYIYVSAAGQTGPAVDERSPARLTSSVGDAANDSVAVTTPVYLGEITYQFSSDASGTFNIDFIDPGVTPAESQTIVVDDNDDPIVLLADGVQINIVGEPIPAASTWGIILMCILLAAAGSVILRRRHALHRPATFLALILVCTILVAASSAGTVSAGSQCPEFGDLNGDHVVDLFDMIEVVNAIESGLDAPGDIEPCGGDNDVDALDLAALTDAFGGTFACAVECLSPGYEPGTWQVPPASLGEASRAGDANPMANVYGYNGEFHDEMEHIRIVNNSFSDVWACAYRSRLGPDTALGYGWDFSYNIYIESDGSDLILHDGHTRADRYELQPDGTWARREFFRRIEKHPDNSYTLTFANKGQWNFHALDASPEEGRIASIVDRNGNTMTFNYDGLGRLTTIHDTLDTLSHNRDMTISYDADGFLSSVCDWASRCVTYDHYDGIEPGGSFGDLKSVTTPAVVSTADFPIPPGHEAPGETTVYTYTTGFADERLNHDLLTITDPKGQTYLTNVYAHTIDVNDPRHTTDPSNLFYNRIVRQILGNPGDLLDIVYTPVIPSEANNFAIVKATTNDRVGDVEECLYDARNRAVIRREYTGRAPDADGPTDLDQSLNVPVNPVRGGDDPPAFVIGWLYNADSLITRTNYANGNATVRVYESDLDPSAPARSRGNLRELHRQPGPLGGDQAEITQLFEYDPVANFDHNFVTRQVDGRGHETLYEYDAAGNRTHVQHRIPSIVEDWEYNASGQVTAHTLPDNGSGHRRRDEFSYYDTGPQSGYLKEVIVDAPNLALTTAFEYNTVGRITRVTDPRNHDKQYIVNQLDEVVRTISREVTDGSGIRYERDYFRDANRNIARVDVQNKDQNGVLQPNTHSTTITEFDVLNYPARTCTESGIDAVPGGQLTCAGLPGSEFITTEYVYDANRNRILSRSGEAVNGDQPDDVVQTTYDERDLVFTVTRAPGVPGPGGQSSTAYGYDGNGNRIVMLQGLEDTPHATILSRDGYNRLVAVLDPMGNVATRHYDANGNTVSRRVDGELNDIEGSAGNVRLYEAGFVLDDMDRLIRTDRALFDTQTQMPIDDGLAVTHYGYSDTSQLLTVTNDNNHTWTTAYDTANRRASVTDPLNNVVTFAYDNNANVTSVTSIEKSDLGNPDQEFTTTRIYDNLDRLIESIDNVGNGTTFDYDSHCVLREAISAANFDTTYTYDGIDRLLSMTRDMDGDGADGDGPDITTTIAYDDNGRTIARTDGNGNATRYAYDALDRWIATQSADGTMHEMGHNISWPLAQPLPDLTNFVSGYDVHDYPRTTTDPNGTIVTDTPDLLNRCASRTVTPGPGVSDDTTFETYEYDGLSRVVSAEDDDSLVTHSYDSLSRTTSETLNGQTTTSLYDGVGNLLQCQYPGTRTISRTHDNLERVKTISDGNGSIATYDYVGPARIERRSYGNGTQTDYTYDGVTGVPNPAGDFGVKKVIRTRHTVSGTICTMDVDCPTGTTCDTGANECVIDDRTNTWDRMYNRTRRADVRPGGPQHTYDYSYDDADRLDHTTVTDAAMMVVRETGYVLDSVGNRTQVVGTPDPGPYVGAYTMDPTLPEPADFQVNQYTTTPADARAYDKTGDLSLIDDGLPTQRNVVYNYRNQMVEFNDLAAGQRHTYAYDPFGRRIAKIIDADGVPTETRYFYDGWQVIEEQSGAGATEATYVNGADRNVSHIKGYASQSGGSMDNPLNMQRGGTDYFYHTDDLGSVMAITELGGIVVERYDYGDFGGPRDADTLAPLLPPGDSSVIGNPYGFTGRRYDPETGWYYYRTRYLDPVAGRFTVRDRIGNWGDAKSLGNAFTYVGNNPWSDVDPLGMGGGCCCDGREYANCDSSPCGAGPGGSPPSGPGPSGPAPKSRQPDIRDIMLPLPTDDPFDVPWAPREGINEIKLGNIGDTWAPRGGLNEIHIKDIGSSGLMQVSYKSEVIHTGAGVPRNNRIVRQVQITSETSDNVLPGSNNNDSGVRMPDNQPNVIVVGGTGPRAGARDIALTAGEPLGLLLPAVQKVRKPVKQGRDSITYMLSDARQAASGGSIFQGPSARQGPSRNKVLYVWASDGAAPYTGIHGYMARMPMPAPSDMSRPPVDRFYVYFAHDPP